MKIIDNVKIIVQNFLKCGVAGWCLEVIFTSVESVLAGDLRLMGKTSLLMFPIYGLGALLAPIGKLVDRWLGDGKRKADGERVIARQYRVSGQAGIVPVHEASQAVGLSPRDSAVRHGMLYMVLIFVVEYISGWWLRALGICPWDYTGRHSNINGLIRLDFAPLWFGTGLLFEKITKKNGG